MQEPIIIVPYNPEWPERFREIGKRIRMEMGDTAIRIDHIGSTSVPDLAAKPVIDIQISVRSFETIEQLVVPLERCGFQWRHDNPDLSKRYFRESPGQPRTHIHVRRAGSWAEQIALLFRDYLRRHPDACKDYADLKYKLAAAFKGAREEYVEAKSPLIWSIQQKADRWSQSTGWIPGESDM